MGEWRPRLTGGPEPSALHPTMWGDKWPRQSQVHLERHIERGREREQVLVIELAFVRERPWGVVRVAGVFTGGRLCH